MSKTKNAMILGAGLLITGCGTIEKPTQEQIDAFDARQITKRFNTCSLTAAPQRCLQRSDITADDVAWAKEYNKGASLDTLSAELNAESTLTIPAYTEADSTSSQQQSTHRLPIPLGNNTPDIPLTGATIVETDSAYCDTHIDGNDAGFEIKPANSERGGTGLVTGLTLNATTGSYITQNDPAAPAFSIQDDRDDTFCIQSYNGVTKAWYSKDNLATSVLETGTNLLLDGVEGVVNAVVPRLNLNK